MADIYDPRHFPFDTVQLGTPFNRNGVHFIKMTVRDSPIYIQPPKCVVKQGFVKSGKRVFCDLVFNTEDNHFLTWLENIEEIAKTQIYENRAKWFETDLDKHDIENSLVPAYKMYKAGKLYIIRANIPTTLGKTNLKVYDENEQEVSHEDLKEDTGVITVVELRGIKCSARSFQFDFDIRQMMVVAPAKLFERCIIKKGPPQMEEHVPVPIIQAESEIRNDEPLEENSNVAETNDERSSIEEQELSAKDEIVVDDEIRAQVHEISANEMDLDIYEVDVDLDATSATETVQLKKRNDVYYKMYKEAKRKAMEAKIVALTNYLEAKRIKATYSLDDSSDDDDETENEDELDREFDENIPSKMMV